LKGLIRDKQINQSLNLIVSAYRFMSTWSLLLAFAYGYLEQQKIKIPISEIKASKTSEVG